MLRPRPVAVALTAVLTELVIVAATGNQKVTDAILQHDPSPRLVPYLESVNAFPWRFTPLRGSGAGQALAAQFAGIAVLLAVVFLVGLLAARARPSGVQVFLLVWFGTVAGAWLGQFVRVMLLPKYYVQPGIDRFTIAVFQSGLAVVFGIFSGLVVGAVALLVAATAQRPEDTAVGYPPPYGPPPGYVQPAGYAQPGYPGTGGYPTAGQPAEPPAGASDYREHPQSAAPDDDTQWYRAPHANDPYQSNPGATSNSEHTQRLDRPEGER